MMAVYAIAPKDATDITKGKPYEVKGEGDTKLTFYIDDDVDYPILCCWKSCAHLGGADWARYEGDAPAHWTQEDAMVNKTEVSIPLVVGELAPEPIGAVLSSTPTKTLRDEFAMAALPRAMRDCLTEKGAVEMAYRYADLMMAEWDRNQ